MDKTGYLGIAVELHLTLAVEAGALVGECQTVDLILVKDHMKLGAALRSMEYLIHPFKRESIFLLNRNSQVSHKCVMGTVLRGLHEIQQLLLQQASLHPFLLLMDSPG